VEYTEENELDSIDAYFAALEKQNQGFQRPKLKPGAPLK